MNTQLFAEILEYRGWANKIWNECSIWIEKICSLFCSELKSHQFFSVESVQIAFL